MGLHSIGDCCIYFVSILIFIFILYIFIYIQYVFLYDFQIFLYSSVCILYSIIIHINIFIKIDGMEVALNFSTSRLTNQVSFNQCLGGEGDFSRETLSTPWSKRGTCSFIPGKNAGKLWMIQSFIYGSMLLKEAYKENNLSKGKWEDGMWLCISSVEAEITGTALEIAMTYKDLKLKLI